MPDALALAQRLQNLLERREESLQAAESLEREIEATQRAYEAAMAGQPNAEADTCATPPSTARSAD